MCYAIKWSEFSRFDFATKTPAEENLSCSYSFKAQAPEDKSLPLRAIVVSFNGESERDTVHIRAECQVVFEVPEGTDIPMEDVFVKENYKAAYGEFCKKANEILTTLGHNHFEFAEIE